MAQFNQTLFNILYNCRDSNDHRPYLKPLNCGMPLDDISPLIQKTFKEAMLGILIKTFMSMMVIRTQQKTLDGVNLH